MLNQRESACHSLRIIAKENAGGVLLLGDLTFQVGNLGISGIENLLSLKNIQFRGHAAFEAQPSQPDGIYLRIDRIVRDLKL